MKPLQLLKKKESSAKIVVSARGHKATAPAAPLAPAAIKIRRVLVPVDFSDHSQNALRYAVAFASQFGAELILVHIVEQMVYPGDWMYPPLASSDFATEKREQILERLKQLSAGVGVKARQIVRLGRAWQEVVEIAKEQKADILIIATHGYTGLKHVLLGSVAEKIVRHAPCPVLTVRPEERDFL